MPTWMRFAWLNRERIVAVARKHKVPLWVLVTLALLVAAGGALYWGFTRGYLHWTNPAGWTVAQWVLLAIYLVGFIALFVDQRLALRRQDEVWDEVNVLRGEVDVLREQLHAYVSKAELQHEVEVAVVDQVHRIKREELPTIDALPSARPQVPGEPRTEQFRAVRAVPDGVNEPGIVERDLGTGRTFSFRG